MTKLPTLDEICARCSKHSGYTLAWSTYNNRHANNVLTIEDVTKPKSRLVLMLNPFTGSLVELSGRMRFWNISAEEMRVFETALKEGWIAPHDYYPVRPIDDAPAMPRRVDEWRREYAIYTSEYRMREGISLQCGWCFLEVEEWDTTYDGWNRCPHCGGN